MLNLSGRMPLKILQQQEKEMHQEAEILETETQAEVTIAAGLAERIEINRL